MSTKTRAERLAEELEAQFVPMTDALRMDTAAELRRIPALEAERDQLCSNHAAAIDLVSRVRMALGDNGTRMQDELIEWCKTLRAPDADQHARDSAELRRLCAERDGFKARYKEALSGLGKVVDERDALRAEVERERTARQQAQDQLEQTQAERNRAGIEARREVAERMRALEVERDELRADAERYRGLRAAVLEESPGMTASEADADVDANLADRHT